MPNRNEHIAALAAAIERYLSAYPNATDSIEGIAGWWLPQQQYHRTKEDVQAALDYLVAKGTVVRVKSANGQLLYCAQRKRERKSEE